MDFIDIIDGEVKYRNWTFLHPLWSTIKKDEVMYLVRVAR